MTFSTEMIVLHVRVGSLLIEPGIDQTQPSGKSSSFDIIVCPAITRLSMSFLAISIYVDTPHTAKWDSWLLSIIVRRADPWRMLKRLLK